VEGYLGLFLSAFLAATLVPLSSEVLLGGMVASQTFDARLLLLAAVLGNTLGAVVNWGLGRFCLRWQDRRWFPVNRSNLERATRWYNHFGKWSLLLAWVPVIGDPLTFAAGVLRTNFLWFLLLVAIGKTGRYITVIGIVDHLW